MMRNKRRGPCLFIGQKKIIKAPPKRNTNTTLMPLSEIIRSDVHTAFTQTPHRQTHTQVVGGIYHIKKHKHKHTSGAKGENDLLYHRVCVVGTTKKQKGGNEKGCTNTKAKREEDRRGKRVKGENFR